MTISNDAASPEIPGFADLAVEEIVAAVAVIIIVISVTWGVITRYVTETPASWTTELAAMAFSWAVFLGAAAAFKRSEHITFDMHISAWPALVRRTVQAIADLVVFATLSAVAILSINFTISTWDVPSTVLQWPQGLLYAGAAVGFVLMVVRHSIAVLRRLQSMGGAR